MAFLQRLTAAVAFLTVVAAGCAASPATIDDPSAAPDSVVSPMPGGSVSNLRAPATTALPPASSDGTFAAAFPGDVAPGSVRWGAAITGNGDPSRHESVAGVPMGVRRTYYGWQHRTGKMIDTARSDLAAGRLPWVSIKTPGLGRDGVRGTQWRDRRDAPVAGPLNGPVWLTVHHEPEGGNGTRIPMRALVARATGGRCRQGSGSGWTRWAPATLPSLLS